MSDFFSPYRVEVFSRALMSVIGGFAFSLFLCIDLSYLLPIETKHAVAWSSMLFFVVFPAVVMWSFAVKDYKVGSLKLILITSVLAFMFWLFKYQGVM